MADLNQPQQPQQPQKPQTEPDDQATEDFSDNENSLGSAPNTRPERSNEQAG